MDAAIAPLTQAVQALFTDSDVRAAMSRLEDTMETAEEALKTLVSDPRTSVPHRTGRGTETHRQGVNAGSSSRVAGSLN